MAGEVLTGVESKFMEQMTALAQNIEQKLAAGEKTYGDVTGEVKSLGEALESVTKKIKEMEEAMSARKWADMPGVNEGKDKFSLFKACSAIANRDFTHAGYEKEVMDGARAKAAQAAGVDTAGGYLVPVQALGGIIELLRSNLVLNTLGATVLTDLVGVPVEVPKQTSSATAYWVAENSALTESIIGLGQLQMNPKGLGALVKMSNRSLRLSNPSLEALVRQDITEQIARALDIAGLRGTGSLGTPIGIVNIPGVATVDFDSTAAHGAATNPSWEAMYELEGKLEDADALKGKLGYTFAPAIKRQMSKLRSAAFATTDQEGAFLQTQPMTAAHISAVLGYPFATTTQLPTNLGSSTDQGEVIFGNWADLLIGMWGGLRLLASQEAGTAFAADQTWVRAIMDVDVAVRHIQSFAVGLKVNKVVDASGA